MGKNEVHFYDSAHPVSKIYYFLLKNQGNHLGLFESYGTLKIISAFSVYFHSLRLSLSGERRYNIFIISQSLCGKVGLFRGPTTEGRAKP